MTTKKKDLVSVVIVLLFFFTDLFKIFLFFLTSVFFVDYLHIKARSAVTRSHVDVFFFCHVSQWQFF